MIADLLPNAYQINKNTTPMYRAPEMIDLYSNNPINEKSDIWVRTHLLQTIWLNAHTPCVSSHMDTVVCL